MAFKIIPANCSKCGKKTVIKGTEKEILCFDCFDERRKAAKIDSQAEQFLSRRKREKRS